MLEHPNLPTALEAWKIEMKLDHRPSVPPHLRHIGDLSDDMPDMSALTLAQLQTNDDFMDQVNAFSDVLNNRSTKQCGCCGRLGHEDHECDSLIKDLVIENYKDKNQAKVAALKKQHDKFPDRRLRRPANSSKKKRSSPPAVRQIADIHDSTKAAYALAMAQMQLPPSSSSSHDDSDEG